MKIVKEALAGTVESSDLMVKISPTEDELEIVIRSEVYKQFGARIREVVEETLAKLGIKEGLIVIEDKGALDCVIQARLQSAVLRAANTTSIDWEKM